MISRIEEHNQSHFVLDLLVVLFEVLSNFVDKLRKIVNLFISTRLNFEAMHEVSEDDSFGVVYLRLVRFEVLFSSLKQLTVEPVSVFMFNQPISKDSFVLVVPQSHQLDLCRNSLVGDRTDSLENL